MNDQGKGVTLGKKRDRPLAGLLRKLLIEDYLKAAGYLKPLRDEAGRWTASNGRERKNVGTDADLTRPALELLTAKYRAARAAKRGKAA